MVRRLGESMFDAAVGDEPDEGDQGVDAASDCGGEEGEGNRGGVEEEGEFAFGVFAQGAGKDGLIVGDAHDDVLQDGVGDGGHEQDCAVEGGGGWSEVVFAHPAGDEGDDGEPEEQVEIGPEDRAGDGAGGMEEVMVVVPVDADVDEGEDVGEEDGEERGEIGKVGGTVGDFQLEDHDGDNDGDDAVAEGFEAGFGEGGSHGGRLVRVCRGGRQRRTVSLPQRHRGTEKYIEVLEQVPIWKRKRRASVGYNL